MKRIFNESGYKNKTILKYYEVDIIKTNEDTSTEDLNLINEMLALDKNIMNLFNSIYRDFSVTYSPMEGKLIVDQFNALTQYYETLFKRMEYRDLICPYIQGKSGKSEDI